MFRIFGTVWLFLLYHIIFCQKEKNEKVEDVKNIIFFYRFVEFCLSPIVEYNIIGDIFAQKLAKENVNRSVML